MAVTQPTAHWTLGEATGEDRVDSIGGLHLAPVNAPAQQFGHVGYGTSFVRASSQYLQGSGSSVLAGSDRNFTFAVVVNPSTFAGSGDVNIIFSKDNGVDYEYELFYSGGLQRWSFAVFNIALNAVVRANNFGVPVAGGKCLIVCWHDATNDQIGISVNNDTPDTTSYSGGVEAASYPFKVGAEAGGFYFDGTVEQLSFWDNHVLDAGEITELWADGQILKLAEFADGEATPEHVFLSNDSGAQGYEAWPATEAISNTRLLCGVTDGTTHVSEDKIIKILQSLDSGDTWAHISDVTEGGVSIGVNYGGLWFDRTAGHLLCAYSRQTLGIIFAPKIQRSTNLGQTWGAWSDVAIPSGYDWLWPYGPFTRIGTDLYGTFYAQVTATGFWNSLLMKSTDDGVNWTLHGVIATGDGTHQYSETSAIRMSGSNWVAVVREEVSTLLAVTRSSNGGSTWDTPTRLENYILQDAVDGATAPALYKETDSIVHLLYGNRAVSPYQIRHYVSPDAGANFYGPALHGLLQSGINPVDFGYPAPVAANKELRYAYYSPDGPGIGVYMDRTRVPVAIDLPELPALSVLLGEPMVGGQIF